MVLHGIVLLASARGLYFYYFKAILFLLQGGAGRACQVGRKDWNEGRPLIEAILSVKRDSSDIKVTETQNWVTYVTRAASTTAITMVHGSQGHAGHVGHAVFFTQEMHFLGSLVTGSRWSRGSRCVFFSKKRVF